MTTASLKVDTTTLTNVLTTPASYGTAIAAFLASLSFERWVTLISLGLAVGTFALNWYYRHREHIREERLANAKGKRNGKA